MRLLTITLVLLTITTALPADDDLAQDGVQDAAKNVAEDVGENAAEAADKDGGLVGLLVIGGMVAFGLTIVTPSSR